MTIAEAVVDRLPIAVYAMPVCRAGYANTVWRRGRECAFETANAFRSASLDGLILAQWPSSAAWTIGTLLGASVFVNGITRVVVAGKIRSGVSEFQNLAKGTA